MLNPKAVFLACLLSLASPGVTMESVTMRLLESRENSTYVNITFTDSDFQELYSCLSMDSIVACSIGVTRVYRGLDALVAYIQPRQSAVNETLSAPFNCTYRSQHKTVECSRLGTEACNSNTPHTSFYLQDPCCDNKCVCFVWNDTKEQLIFDNSTLEIHDANCSLAVIESEPVPPSTPFLNETSHEHALNSTVKDITTSAYDHSPPLIVALVVVGFIAVDIIIVVAFMLYGIRRGGSHMEDVKIVEEKATINTGSFRTLAIELPTEYVNTAQSRLYSGLEFGNEFTTEQHNYAKMEASAKLQNTDEYNTHNVYEETGLCKPTDVTIKGHYTNSFDSSNRSQLEDEGMTYLTIPSSYAILEDLKDDSSEVNGLIKSCFTVETSYIDLNDESTYEMYVKADTESDNSDSKGTSRSHANIYANTEASFNEEIAEYANVSPWKITIKL